MATSQIAITATPPKPPNSQEPTKDAPLRTPEAEGAQSDQTQGDQAAPMATTDASTARDKQNLEKYGPQLLTEIEKMRETWAYKRRGIIQCVITNKEMKKGNHNIGFLPGSTEIFDAFQQYNNFAGAANPDQGDRAMDQRPHNFYQMLMNAFIAALSAQVPKNRWLPSNADETEDRETAKSASRIEEIIERTNQIEDQVKQELGELFTSGMYAKFTRYAVDEDRCGTHKETTLTVTKTDVVPARAQCFNCGAVTPIPDEANPPAACPQCGTPFGPESFYPGHVDEMPIAQEKTDVPNGMVLQNIYGPMHIDADPDAMTLDDTPLLNLSLEVARGWLRQTFPDFWDKFQPGQSSGSTSEQIERQLRDRLTAAQGSMWTSYSAQQKPTYQRTWCQPMLFAEMDDKQMAQELMKEYPKGCMIAYVGDMPLYMRASKLAKEWTVCLAEKGFGLFPQPVGNPAVPLQQRLNDCINKIDEFLDRLCVGIIFCNEEYIDSKAMNGKQMLPGILNGIKFRKGAAMSSIQDAIFQFKAEISPIIMEVVSMLKQDMELLVGTPPQTFGAGTQSGVETATGQAQQQNTGMTKMGLSWSQLRLEHAASAEIAVMCAAKNMTDDWQSVVLDETKEFRAEYVHLDQIKGSVHAEPETDQGFPMSWADRKNFFEQLMQQGGEILDFLIQEPENIDTMLRFMGVSDILSAPGKNMRTKALAVIYKLVQQAPIQQQDPATGQVVMVPSLQPNKYLDDLKAWQKFIPSWSEKHWDKLENNPNGIANLVAFYKQTIVMDHELQIELQMPMPGQAPGAMPPGMPPPGAGAPQPQPAMA